MRRYCYIIGSVLAVFALAVGCDVPAPPGELRAPTVTPALRGTPVAPTPAPPPPTLAANGGGYIWFVRGGTLWLAEPDGDNPVQKSTQPVDSPPVPSPDGRRG